MLAQHTMLGKIKLFLNSVEQTVKVFYVKKKSFKANQMPQNVSRKTEMSKSIWYNLEEKEISGLLT